MANATETEPKVSVFGNEVTTDKRQENGVVGGALFLIAGGVLLLNSLGVIPWGFWNTVWQFWPIILILIGLEIILGKNALSRIVVLVVALISLGIIAAYALKTINSPLYHYVPLEAQQGVNFIEQITTY